MMRMLRYLFFGMSTVVLQTTLVPAMAVAGQRPDLVVIFAVMAGAWEGSRRGALAGFTTGLLVDLYHPPTLGAGAMAGALAGYLGGKAQIFLDMEMPLNQAVGLAGAHLAHHLLYGVVAALKGEWNPVVFFLTFGPGGALYTALLGTIIFGIGRLARGRRPDRDRR